MRGRATPLVRTAPPTGWRRADQASADTEWGGTPAVLGNSGAPLYDLACDQRTRLGAAPARPRAAAPRPGQDRPGVRAAAGRRGARSRRAHVGRAPRPPVPACLRAVAHRLPDNAADHACEAAA